MMKVLLLALSAIISLIYAQQLEEICFSNVTDPYLLFSTKTGYSVVDNEEVKPIEFKGCEAKSFWLLARHGTRNPGDDDIKLMLDLGPKIRDRIVNLHEKGHGLLCTNDVETFNEWSLNLTVLDDAQLTESGFVEQKILGERFRQRFPGLLDQPYDPNLYRFRHTIKDRAEDSAKAYVQGAFPNDEVVIDEPLDEDPLLRFYDFCTKWIYEVDEADSTYEEQHRFVDSDFIESTVSKVNERIGASDSDVLTFKDVSVMYDICRYEKAFRPDEVSIWCAPFDEDDLKILEYHQDLEYWWKNGYSYEINTKMSCPLLKDVYSIFSNEANQTERPLGTFYFSHSEAVLPFLGLLGLYKDDLKLLSDNYEANAERLYKTSEIGSFSTSVAFVLFECQEDPLERVLVMHQEKPVKLGKCKEVLCDWQQFKENYKDDIACEFDQLCENSSNKTSEKFNTENQATFLANSSLLGIILSLIVFDSSY